MRPMLPALLVLALVALPILPAAASGEPISGPKKIMPIFDPNTPPLVGAAQAAAASNMIYHGGSIEKTPAVYIVFWCWKGSDPSGEKTYLTNFFTGVGGSAWIGSQTQYTETSRGAITNPSGQLKGTWVDDSCVTPPVPDAQIANEALAAAAHFGYNKDADYIIATPHLHNDAEFGARYCAWHSSVKDALNRPVAYTDLPYIPDAQAGVCGQNFVNAGNAGLLDGVSIVGGHEYAEAMTDPALDAWYDAGGQENGDKCAWISSGTGASHNIVLSTGTFAIQTLWSNSASKCV